MYIGLVDTWFISTPAIIPDVTFIIKNPTIAANDATPSPEVIPIATPTANINGKLVKIILPDDDIIFAIIWNLSPAKIGKVFKKSWFSNKVPIPIKSPATGNNAIGKVKDFPTLCKTPNDFLNNIPISIFPPICKYINKFK